MEVHRQQCQNCQSFETRNILVRQGDQKPIVYVRCGTCGELVARYRLSEYYHHGKGSESFLRSRGANAVESGRRMLREFEEIQRESIAGYAEVLKYLEDHDMHI